jgi:hypothetical protein
MPCFTGVTPVNEFMVEFSILAGPAGGDEGPVIGVSP